jgi:hypothetical protein
MFFDTLESRYLCSVSIPSAQISIPSNLHLPDTIQVQAQAAPKKAAVSSPAALAKSKALLNAVLKAEIKLLSNILAGKVKNLKQDLGDLRNKAAKARNHLQGLLGSTVSVNVSVPTNQLAAIRGLAGATDHLGKLIGNPGQQFTGGRTGQVSEDPKGGKGIVQSIKDFFSSDETKEAGKDAAETALEVGVEKFGPPGGGEALTLLQGPSFVESVTGDAKDFLNGFIAIFNSGEKDPRMPDRNGNIRTPLPDDVSNTTSGVITAQDLKGLLARLGSRITPTGEESRGGGAVNTGANGTGKLGSQATFTDDSVSTTVSISARDLAALAIRLTSKMNVRR